MWAESSHVIAGSGQGDGAKVTPLLPVPLKREEM